MSQKLLGKLLLSILLVTGVLAASGAAPAYAAGSTINRFAANCNNFSVDVTVAGTNNDGNNVDKFRYLITDANGKKLYQEDNARGVGTSQNSVVANLPYDADGVADGAPGKNPITFSVLELDGNNNVVSTIRQASYDAACLGSSGSATNSGVFRPPEAFKAAVIADSPLYDQPGGNTIQGLSTHPGQSWIVVYRTGDNQWLSIFVGGPEIVWVPARVLAVDINQLPVRPGRIEGGSPGPSPTGVAPAPGGITVRTTANLNVRNAPSVTGLIIGRVGIGTVLPALGRSASSFWVLVQFNGVPAWVSSYYVRVYGGRLRDLPIVR